MKKKPTTFPNQSSMVWEISMLGIKVISDKKEKTYNRSEKKVEGRQKGKINLGVVGTTKIQKFTFLSHTSTIRSKVSTLIQMAMIHKRRNRKDPRFLRFPNARCSALCRTRWIFSRKKCDWRFNFQDKFFLFFYIKVNLVAFGLHILKLHSKCPRVIVSRMHLGSV